MLISADVFGNIFYLLLYHNIAIINPTIEIGNQPGRIEPKQSPKRIVMEVGGELECWC